MTTTLLWDHDGVLVDTEHLYFQATREVMASAGATLTEALYQQHFLVESSGAWHLVAARGVDAAEIARLKALRDARYAELLATGDRVRPGVREMLTALATRFRMAIVTAALARTSMSSTGTVASRRSSRSCSRARTTRSQAASRALPGSSGPIRRAAGGVPGHRGLAARYALGEGGGPALLGGALAADRGLAVRRSGSPLRLARRALVRAHERSPLVSPSVGRTARVSLCSPA